MREASGHESAPLVLVVEDSEDAFAIAYETLVSCGFRVIGAGNGIDAVDTAVKLLPDVILMDLSLPLMGGCEAMQLLKSDDRTCSIPIVVLTGDSHRREAARRAGCKAFLTKPCPPNELVRVLRDQIARAAEPETVGPSSPLPPGQKMPERAGGSAPALAADATRALRLSTVRRTGRGLAPRTCQPRSRSGRSCESTVPLGPRGPGKRAG